VDNDHATIVKKFDEKVNALVRAPIERQLGKKRMNVSSSVISKKIMSKIIFRRMTESRKIFCRTLVF
jgi:hypothetical protein